MNIFPILNQRKKVNITKHLKSAIHGFVVADALGVPYEFQKRGTFECTSMIGDCGIWNQPTGTWSDDSSMTLATLDSIKKTGCIDVEDIRQRFKDWAFKAKYTANNEVFDIGGTTYQALRENAGIDDFHANGNGSLMRILPLAFIKGVSRRDVFEVSSITHAHIISKEACNIYVEVAKDLIKGMKIEDSLKYCAYSAPFERLSSIAELPESEIKSTGYVVDTLEAVMWCLCNTDNYKDAVLKAVNLGGDTDTIAAIAGGLAGIMYGYESIPKEWIDKLRNKELIESILI